MLAAAREVQQRQQHFVVTLTDAWSTQDAAAPERGTRDVCPTPMCLSVLTQQLGPSSAQPSYAVITPPDGTADILLEIPNNSLLRPIFQALI